MRKLIGWGVAEVYRLAGARRRAVVRAKAAGALLPIVFHAAKAEEVRAILAWLKTANLLDRVRLSFDDGWREFGETVRVLDEFETSATLFIAPGETRRGVVWTHGLTVAERQRLYALDEQSRYNEITLLRDCGAAGSRALPRPLLNEDEVREVSKHPLVRLGNHTWSHMSCPHRPVEEVLDEVDRAQAELADWCGYAPTDFAYPFGRGTPELDAALRRRGLTPHYTRQGLVTAETIGSARNMVYEGMSLAENLGRILMAWPRVGETL